jgi:hypothetical protein
VRNIYISGGRRGSGFGVGGGFFGRENNISLDSYFYLLIYLSLLFILTRPVFFIILTKKNTIPIKSSCLYKVILAKINTKYIKSRDL